MNESEAGTPRMRGGLDALRRFTRTQPPVERCELCGAVLEPQHPHLLERRTRRVACSCRACALLFFDQPNGHYVRIPERVLRLDDFAFTDLEWEELMLPIGLVFFVRDAAGQIGAFYPGPAGIVESLVSMDVCAQRFAAHPLLASMQPEVEALLVNRVGANRDYFLIPVDACFRLAGLIRQNWRGLGGGPSVWAAVAGFFDELQQRVDGKSQVRYA